MILTIPEELSQYLPNHVLQNLDNLQGFFAISEADFLADRLGRPLLEAMQQHYNELAPVRTIDDIDPDSPDRPWHELILLCQPVVAFDAVSRAADIQAVSVNQGGINIAETGGYDIAPDKFIANYKAQCIKEAHAAVNRLLIKLEDWQKQVALATATDGSAALGETLTPPLGTASSLIEIVTLWQQSAYYYYADGLLFSTAQHFGAYVDIYESREKFIQLIPDIRYCQEVHLEAEIGEELLLNLIQKRRDGTLNNYEAKAYRMLQRTLSLYVVDRVSWLSSRNKAARDEACGHMDLTLKYITTHQQQFDPEAMALSPLYQAPSGGASAPAPDSCCCAPAPSPNTCGTFGGGTMLVSSLI